MKIEPGSVTKARPLQSGSAPTGEVTPGRKGFTALSVPIRSIVPYANFAAQKAGPIGVMGIALAVFAITLRFATIAPLQQQLLSDTQYLEQIASAESLAAPTPVTRATDSADEFIAALPGRDELPGVLSAVLAAASAAGVELEKGDYKFIDSGGDAEIDRYRLVFPVVGSYPQVRSFMDRALEAVPAMALEGVSLTRDAVTSSLVESELTFIVLVRAD